jgi:hypothetical protein
MTNDRDVSRIEDPEARLEQAFIDEYLRARGYDADRLRALAGDEVRQLMSAASIHAAAKLAAIEARAHFVDDLHT